MHHPIDSLTYSLPRVHVNMTSGEVVNTGYNSSNVNEIVWESGIKLTECRFLAASKCKSACVNLCKLPCQSLFQEHLGIPLYMKPDYTDYSCTFHFGIAAPSMEQDPAFNNQCFSDCGVSKFKSGNTTMCV